MKFCFNTLGIEGRYRSTNQYVNDVRYIIGGKVLKKVVSTLGGDKAAKEKATTLGNHLLVFLKDVLEPKLQL